MRRKRWGGHIPLMLVLGFPGETPKIPAGSARCQPLPPWRRRPSALTRPPTKPSPPSTQHRHVLPPPTRKTSAPTNWSCWQSWRSKIGECQQISAPFGLFIVLFFQVSPLKSKALDNNEPFPPSIAPAGIKTLQFLIFKVIFFSLKAAGFARSGRQRGFLEGGSCLEIINPPTSVVGFKPALDRKRALRLTLPKYRAKSSIPGIKLVLKSSPKMQISLQSHF